MSGDGLTALERALSGKGRASKILDGFEGVGARFRGIPLAFVALSTEDTLDAQREARAFVLDVEKFPESMLFSAVGEQHMDFATKVFLLARTLADPDTLVPVATNAKGDIDARVIRRMLEPDDVTQLYELYVDWMAERSPISRAKSWEDIRGEIDALGKGMTAPSSLTRFDGATLRAVVLELARERHELEMALATARSNSTSGSSSPTSSSSA